VTAIALIILLPRFGITGAAIASLTGYSVMLFVALLVFVKKRGLSLWFLLRPQWRDFSGWQSLRRQAFAKRSTAPPEGLISRGLILERVD